MAGNDKTQTTDGSASSSSSPYSRLPKDIKNHALGSFLSIADIAKGMKLINRESNSFFANKKFYQKRLEKLGVPPEQLASLDLKTIEIIARQLEELKQNSPQVFKKIKQNYLDTGIPCLVIFSLQVDERLLSSAQRQNLSDKAAECNNVALLHYLSSNGRGEQKTPVCNATLAKAAYAANLSLIKAMLDPAGGMMSITSQREAEIVTTMIIRSQNFSVMQWVLETLVAEPGNSLLKQKIQKNLPLNSGELIKAAVFGGENFYTQMSAFITAHPNSFPEMSEALLVANYYNELVNNGCIDDFNWITNSNDPRLANDNHELFVIVVFRANNLQLVSNFFAVAINDNRDTWLKAPFSELPSRAWLQYALMYSSDLTILEFTYKKLLEEYQFSLSKGVESFNLDEEMKAHFETTEGQNFDDFCLMVLMEYGTYPHLLAEQLKILHITPTIQQLAMAVSQGSYKLATIMSSDSMGAKKVAVTRESLQDAFIEIEASLPSSEIIDKLFNFQADAPAPGVS